MRPTRKRFADSLTREMNSLRSALTMLLAGQNTSGIRAMENDECG
jgi:hypothetical protein